MTEATSQTPNLLRGISENGGIVFYGVDSTEIVRQAEHYHKTSAVTTAALGRLLTAASMMGMMLKSRQDTITIQIKGGGPAAVCWQCLMAAATCAAMWKTPWWRFRPGRTDIWTWVPLWVVMVPWT